MLCCVDYSSAQTQFCSFSLNYSVNVLCLVKIWFDRVVGVAWHFIITARSDRLTLMFPSRQEVQGEATGAQHCRQRRRKPRGPTDSHSDLTGKRYRTFHSAY